MFFTKESFEQFCPEYQKAVLKLEKRYLSISDDDEDAVKAKKNLILEFSEKYLTPKEIWDEFFRVSGHLANVQEGNREHFAAVQKSNILHFYFNHDVYFCNYESLNKRMIHFQIIPSPHHALYADEKLRPRFTYPHLQIESEYRILEEFSSYPITKDENERYQYMKNLCAKIKAAEEEGDNKTWFELLKKADNAEFLVHSVEYRLGKDMDNIELWKIYIEFCKQQSSKKNLLDIFSKYCRYFMDDKKTKKEYKNAVKNYVISEFDNNVQEQQKRSWIFIRRKHKFHCVNWKNTFKFEKHVPKEMPVFSPLFPSDLCRVIKLPEEFMKPNFETYRNQIFPFSKPMMTYLLQHRSSQLLHKFHKCCKYFFVIIPYPVCHLFCAGNRQNRYTLYPKTYPLITIYGQSLAVQDENSLKKLNTRIGVSNSFNVVHESRNLLSSILKYVYFCEAKYVSIYDQNITLKELKFLIGHGKTEDLDFRSVKIFDPTGNLVPLEETLKMVPKIVKLYMDKPYITSATSQIMSELKFNNYIKEFHLWYIDNTLEPNGFLAFLKKNFIPYFFVDLLFLGRNPAFKEFIHNHYESDKNAEKNYKLRICP